MSKLDNATFLTGDATEKLSELDENSIHCVVTSPPYFGLRDYHADGQIGLEEDLEEYIGNLTEVFNQVRRVLHPSGTFWLNIGDSYAGSGGPGGDFRDGKGGDNYGRSYDRDVQGLKKKDLCMVPSRVALRQQSEGWWLRSEIIWAKAISFNDEYTGSCMPESATDRPTNSHEKLYLFSKSRDYFYDEEEGKDLNGGRKPRDVWTFNPSAFSEEHFATYPLGLVEPCVKAGSSSYGVCSKCGAPYERKTEVVSREVAGGLRDIPEESRGNYTKRQGGSQHDRGGMTQSEKETVGWEPTCNCEASVEPATVLDPFSGAATTGVAALKHGRKYIGIDVNGEYNEMAKKRVREHGDVPANHDFW
jgi:DNA modification methylase